MNANLLAKGDPIYIKSTYYLKQHEFEQNVLTSFQNYGRSDVNKVQGEFLIFDLSECYWHDLGTLLWLISLLHSLRKQGNDFQLIFPEPNDKKGSNLWDFLIRWRFFETLSECVDDAVNLLKPEQIPYMKRKSKYSIAKNSDEYGRETFLHSLKILEMTTVRSGEEVSSEDALGRFLLKYNDKIIISALSRLCGWDEALTNTFFHRVLREGIQNSLLHSEGSFANISMRLDAKKLTLAIADNGIGIPRVLRHAFKRSRARRDLITRSDVDLIKYYTEPDIILDSRFIKLSVEKGVTSQKDRKGVGLYYLKSLVLSQGGEIRIRSGKACVDFTQDKESPVDEMLDSPGTLLRIQTPLK